MFGKQTIPSRYDVIKGVNTTIALSESYGEAMVKMGIADPDAFFEEAPEEGEAYTGRGTVKIVAIPGRGDERVVVPLHEPRGHHRKRA